MTETACLPSGSVVSETVSPVIRVTAAAVAACLCSVGRLLRSRGAGGVAAVAVPSWLVSDRATVTAIPLTRAVRPRLRRALCIGCPFTLNWWALRGN